MQTELTLLQNFAYALAIGALVGIEREKHKVNNLSSFGGVRTFMLLALLGAVGAWLSEQLQQPWLELAVLTVVAALVVVAYHLKHREELQAPGLTTELSAVLVFLLGGAVMHGHAGIAVAIAIMTSAILAFKQPLHGLVAKIGNDDLFAGLKLLIASFVVLPLLPDHALDPWQAFNPYKIWLLVILISVLSLVGYVATRLLGPARGTAVAGLAGGLVSSTAVSLSFARLSRQLQGDDNQDDALACGILLAWSVMSLRVLLMVGIVCLPLLAPLWPAVSAMALVTLATAAYFYRRAPQLQANSATSISNPFSLWAASQFGLMFALVLLVVKLTEHFAPAEGLYLVAAIAGTTDVDAITLSMAQYAQQAGREPLAATALVIAVISNTLVKTALVTVAGSAGLRRRLFGACALVILSATLLLWAL
ncbi:MgtC/SapB family protein [Rheinheimera texasensis]|uniref:MgtC/SapB family protein n=1 Tax=Rheinheimera texasensis TaxID=306205 RepID=UPI0032B1ED27